MIDNRARAWFLVAAAIGVVPTVSGATITYVNWTSSTGPTSNAGTVSGTLFGTINVSYSGELQFAQTGTNSSTWGGYLPVSTFTSSLVSNAPPNAQIIAIDGFPSFTDTVTFSSPVNNLIMDIVSLGRPGSSTPYTFNAPFTILNIGPSNQYGGGTNTLSESGNTLTGAEADGIIEFAGPISSLSWTGGATPEFWNGFTFGAQSAVTSATPEPATVSLAGIGMILTLALRKLRTRRAERG
jgi:PEP-CTERM motif